VQPELRGRDAGDQRRNAEREVAHGEDGCSATFDIDGGQQLIEE
jgi:hypothetical protein